MTMVNTKDNLSINKEMVMVHIFGKMEEGINLYHYCRYDGQW